MTVYTWSGFSKRRNSTKQPANGTQRTVRLKSPTSLIHPVFLLSDFHLTDNYLKWGNRYYFIDDIIIMNDNMAEYHCSVDALASWKNEIGNMSEFVTRAASAYNPSLIDSFYPMLADQPQTAYTAVSDFAEFVQSEGSYIVGIINGETAASGSVSYYAFTAEKFAALCSYLFAVDAPYLDLTEADITLATQKELVNPFQYIVSCFWVPFDAAGSAVYQVKFGWWTASGYGITGKLLRPENRNKRVYTSEIILPAHPEAATRGSYLNCSPFTRRTLYCFTFGQIPLDPSFFANGLRSMWLAIDIDLFTGGGKLTIYNHNGDTLGVHYAQFAIEIPIAQLSQKVEAPINTVVDTVQNLLTLDFAGALSSVENGVKAMYPVLMSQGTSGSNVDYLLVPKIVSEFRYQTQMDAAQNGRPLCQQKVINTLSGYIKTENADVDLPCTQEERDTIATYMNSGFFYE